MSRITANVSADGKVGEFVTKQIRAKLAELAGHTIEIVIRQHRAKRSLDQNAYLHAEPIPRMAEHLGYTIPEMKIVLMGECFGWHVKSGHMLPVKASTAAMTVDECRYFIDWVIPWAAQEHGVIVMLPDEWHQRTEAA